VYGGGDGTTQATWLFTPEAFDLRKQGRLVPVTPEVYACSTPVAGMLDPKTKRLDAKNGRYFYFASPPTRHTAPGTTFRYQTGGGGGWGDPLTRDPERVKRDVRDEYVSIEGALRDYGVVVQGDPIRDPEGLKVDLAATERRRAEMRAARA
jgi:N-methylhydantoinase B